MLSIACMVLCQNIVRVQFWSAGVCERVRKWANALVLYAVMRIANVRIVFGVRQSSGFCMPCWKRSKGIIILDQGSVLGVYGSVCPV